jgi:DUF438 domain-containing protein
MSEAIDNAAKRAAGFLRLLDAMTLGGDVEAVQAAKPLIDDARPEDLVMVVDAAVARCDDFAVLKPAVSRLVNLLASSLKRHRDGKAGGSPSAGTEPDERFFASLKAENEGLARVLKRGKTLSKAINAQPGGDAVSPKSLRDAMTAMRALVDELGAIELHYRKKENVLFPWFEARYPEYRCVRLMWEIQDDARSGLKEVGRMLDEALASDLKSFDPARLNQAVGRLYFDLNANIFREEYALFPVMTALVGAADGEKLFMQAREYGFAFLDAETAAGFENRSPAGGGGQGALDGAALAGASATASAGAMSPTAGLYTAAGFAGKTGSLPNEVLAAMFSVLPVDMTWVDADDKVRWFSDSPHRIFPRSPAIVGRDVRNCHPGASVGRVVSIIESFKSGSKDREAFWITMGGRFIHIEYFALRSPEGAYLGVLEASQDTTGLRALSGEKRLAD